MKTSRSLRLVSVLAAAAVMSACGSDNNDPPAAGPTPAPGPAPAPTPPGPGSLSVKADTVVAAAQANDLRGVTFARSGKVYVSGHQGLATADRKTVVGRFNADGTIDSSFGTGGWVVTNLREKDPANTTSTGDEQSPGIVELANGDVVVAVNLADGNGGAPIGTSTVLRPEGVSIVLLRLDSTGKPVTSFGTNGRAEVGLGWSQADDASYPVPALNAEGTALATGATGFPRDTAWTIGLDSSAAGNERIVIFAHGPAAYEAGATPQRTDNDRYVARVLASTGAADPGFNDGKALTWTTPGTLSDGARGGEVEPDGSIISGGYTGLGTGQGNHCVLLRIDATGKLDPAFAGFSASPVVPAQPGVAVFNPFKVDSGAAECYGTTRLGDGSYVTTGYGGATAITTPPTASTLGYASTLQADFVSFRVQSGGLVPTWGGKNVGGVAVQSEGKSRPTNEDRGRAVIRLADDRTVHVGRYGGNSAVFVFDPTGTLDKRADVGASEAAGAASGDGILELTNPTVAAQFFAAAASADGKLVATTTNADDNGARLLILQVN